MRLRDGRPWAEQVADIGGPWWLFLGGAFAGLNLAFDFGRYALRSDGAEQLGNVAMAAAGVVGAAWSALIVVTKRRLDRRNGPLDSRGPQA